ncbi:MAG: response regulator [Bacteroidia bacterium]|jgi:two-component system LytT family response regulator|nr:response regulator [Bacteroidia bacterium]
MIKVIIIDDEPLARGIVKEYLSAFNEVEVVLECNDGFEGVKAIQQHNPDIIFLDVQMPKINGFEMLELIDKPPAVIFTTAFDEYAMKAFDNNAVDYLLKPFSKERFDKAFEKWMNARLTLKDENQTEDFIQNRTRNQDENSRIVVKTHHAIRIIPVHDIIYLEAYDDYVKIHTNDGMFLKKRTMASFEQGLNQDEFIRVHRSYMIKIDQLTRIEHPDKDSHVALLKTGAKIPLSKTGYQKLKTVLGM